MKSISKILFVLLIISQLAAAQPLKLSVFQPKEKYIIGEDVEIGISLKNVSESEIRTDLRGSVQIRIFNKDGIELPYVGPTGDSWFSPMAEALRSGEEAYNIVLLNTYFGKCFSAFLGNSYFDPGEYLVKIYFKCMDMPTDFVSLSFKVIEPYGDESITYNNFIKTLSLVGTSQYNHQRFIGELRSLADAHPNSVYLPSILEVLQTTYMIWLDNKEMGLKVEEEIMDKCYKSGRYQLHFDSFIRSTKSKTEKIEKLRSWKEKMKGSVMEKHVDIKLKKELEN